MRKTADAVIIGGGIVGASIGWHLARAGGTRVVILEREPAQGRGSTGKATGGVRAQFSTDVNIRMSMESIRFFAEFEEHVGGDCGYLPYGYLFVALNEEEMQMLRANHQRQQAAGLTNVELLDREQVARLMPQLRVNDILGGTFCPTDGFLNPPATMQAFTRAARDRGVELETETEARKLERDAAGIARVVTNRGEISTRVVVNAAGAWAGAIARLAGVEVPVTPLRRQLVAVDADLALSERAPMMLEIGGGFHFRRGPWDSARTPLLMGRPGRDEKPGFEIEVRDEETASVLERARYRLPALGDMKMNLQHTRAGLYEMTPDHHAIVGEVPDVRGFFLANGFSGHGVMHSPATGRIISELILHGETHGLDIFPLRLERFAEGNILQETAVL